MDDNVKIENVVLDNIVVIYEHKFVSIKQAIDAVNNGDAEIELENNGMEINMFIREKNDG